MKVTAITFDVGGVLAHPDPPERSYRKEIIAIARRFGVRNVRVFGSGPWPAARPRVPATWTC